MNSNQKPSIFKNIFQVIEDSVTIIKGEIELAKNNLTFSLKKFSIGVAFLISAFFLLNLTLLFFLIALAFGFADLGIATWLSFLIVGLIILILVVIFILIGFDSFRKMKGIGEASRVGSETKKYLKENISKLSN
jgi:hypothetical protein